MMRNWLTTICLIGSFSALARLGENQVQFAQRYGNPLEARGQTNRTRTVEQNCTQSYDFQGWRLTATFVGGAAEQAEYQKMKGVCTDQDIQAILQAEAGGGRWYQAGYRRWTNSNGSVCSKADFMSILKVRSGRAVQREAAAKAARNQAAPPPKF